MKEGGIGTETASGRFEGGPPANEKVSTREPRLPSNHGYARLHKLTPMSPSTLVSPFSVRLISRLAKGAMTASHSRK